MYHRPYKFYDFKIILWGYFSATISGQTAHHQIPNLISGISHFSCIKALQLLFHHILDGLKEPCWGCVHACAGGRIGPHRASGPLPDFVIFYQAEGFRIVVPGIGSGSWDAANTPFLIRLLKSAYCMSSFEGWVLFMACRLKSWGRSRTPTLSPAFLTIVLPAS